MSPEPTTPNQPLITEEATTESPFPDTRLPQSAKVLIAALLTALIAALSGLAYFMFQPRFVAVPETVETEIPAPPSEFQTEEMLNETESVDTSDWQTYTDPNHGFSIKYPANYQLSGELAASLNDWKAGEGITISNPNHSAKPEVFIEAMYDGYGPIFSTGEIHVYTSEQKLRANLSKIPSDQYQDMINQGLIQAGENHYMSRILYHNDVPLHFNLKHTGQNNEELENELLAILQTFQLPPVADTGLNTQLWQTYANSRCDDNRGSSPFSIKYPPGWTVKDSIPETRNVSSVSYEFSDGSNVVTLQCGEGFGGGGCENLTTLKIGDREVSSCLFDTENGKTFSLASFRTPKATFDFSANFLDQDEKLIRAIFETFRLEN